ncbi:spore wall protein 2-like [Neltuma alba]|uniref:spore wall protein 2-like n=1 Tax=Neltuma alba TaxID=207710 RepID=UPI0010A3CF1E|nr:spore wall protein 2-like [Prosopis alba]
MERVKEGEAPMTVKDREVPARGREGEQPMTVKMECLATAMSSKGGSDPNVKVDSGEGKCREATHKFKIRGRTEEIEANDMGTLLGVPHIGKEELKEVHQRMMDALDESHKRLSNQFVEELMKVQLHLEGMQSLNLKDFVDNIGDEEVILPSDSKGEKGGSDKGDNDGDITEGKDHDQEGGIDEGDDDGEEGDSEKGDNNGEKGDDDSNNDDGGDKIIERLPTNIVYDEENKGVGSLDKETDKGEDQKTSKGQSYQVKK